MSDIYYHSIVLLYIINYRSISTQLEIRWNQKVAHIIIEVLTINLMAEIDERIKWKRVLQTVGPAIKSKKKKKQKKDIEIIFHFDGFNSFRCDDEIQSQTTYRHKTLSQKKLIHIFHAKCRNSFKSITI